MDPLRSETCWSTFKYFIILIISTNYILVHLLDNEVFNSRQFLLLYCHPQYFFIGRFKLHPLNNQSDSSELFLKINDKGTAQKPSFPLE